MTKKNNSCCHEKFKTTIGGQALIEGIMMRGPEKDAIVIRGKEGLTLEGLLSDGCGEDSLVEHIDLRRAVNALPEQQRQVILLRYYRALTQSECARVLGVSQVQVSRLERRALAQLRQDMT